MQKAMVSLDTQIKICATRQQGLRKKSLDGNSQSTSRRDETDGFEFGVPSYCYSYVSKNSKAGNYSDVSISVSQAEYSMSQNAKNANSQETSFPDLHTINSKQCQ